MSACCNNGFKMVYEVMGFKMWMGLIGPPGPAGATYTPSVSSDGTLSWTNNGGLPNPSPVNIKGPPGEPQTPSDAEPLMDGTASAGISTDYARGDHRHPSDYNKAPVITDTASGSVASFPDGADGMPLKSLMVNIEPVQAGSGEPSPTNIRPISGWTGCNISHSGEDTSNPPVMPISWQTEAGTVYGGTLNIEEGTLTAVLAGHVFDGTETFTHVNGGLAWPSAPSAKIIGTGGGSRVNTLRCSHLAPALQYISAAAQRVNAICPWVGNGKPQFILGYVTGVSSDEDMVAYLQQQYAAGTPVTVVYELEQPVTYQLDPPEMQDFLKTLYGENNIFADCGPVTVEYPADTKLYIAKSIAAAVAAL